MCHHILETVLDIAGCLNEARAEIFEPALLYPRIVLFKGRQSARHVGRYYIVLNSHTSRIFVEKCDFISAFGWGTGGADARRKLGIPGGGPRYCVTPMCVFDFAEDTKRLRLRSVHRGTSAQDVQANTGFALAVPTPVPETDPPTVEELRALRTRVDQSGFLRRNA